MTCVGIMDAMPDVLPDRLMKVYEEDKCTAAVGEQHLHRNQGRVFVNPTRDTVPEEFRDNPAQGILGPSRMARGDLKSGRGDKKPPLHWIPLWALQGVSRVFGYGAKRYDPGNWLLASRETTRQALDDYLSAALRHIAALQEPGLTEEATDALLTDFAELDEESGLPHIDHILCGLMMLRGILIKRGILAADPGRGNEPVPVSR